MNILIACEESQRVCVAFREKGHNAFSCDIIECSGGHPEWHIQGDVLKVLNPSLHSVGISEENVEWYGIYFQTMDGCHHFIDGKWDMLIAHPPCTYLSNAGARFLYPKGILNEERLEKGIEAKEFFMKIYNTDILFQKKHVFGSKVFLH